MLWQPGQKYLAGEHVLGVQHFDDPIACDRELRADLDDDVLVIVALRFVVREHAAARAAGRSRRDSS